MSIDDDGLLLNAFLLRNNGPSCTVPALIFRCLLMELRASTSPRAWKASASTMLEGTVSAEVSRRSTGEAVFLPAASGLPIHPVIFHG